MATPSKAPIHRYEPSHTGELPSWFACEAYRAPELFGWMFRAGLRCRDGDLKILDIPIEVLVSPGRSDRITLTKREVLEELQKHVAVELAKIALEDQ